MASKKAAAPAKNLNGGTDKKSESNLPLFYESPVLLNSATHADLALKKNIGYGFAAKTNAVPITMMEMPQVAACYPIAFAADETATPVAIVGLRRDENLFVNKKNEWEAGNYIPAYVRRYPFIFAQSKNSDKFSLSADINKNTTEKNGEQMFFNKDGTTTEVTNNALEFCKAYHAHAMSTLEFAKALVKQDLLVAREAVITLDNKQKINLGGLRVIDEQKLAKLPDNVVLDWHKKGWMAMAYAQLLSGAQWQRLNQRLKTVLKG